MLFSRHADLRWGLLTILLAASTAVTAFAQDDRQNRATLVVEPGTEQGAEGEVHKDSPSGRAKWFREWFGPVSNDYLDYKNLIAEQEHTKWAYTIPGTQQYRSARLQMGADATAVTPGTWFSIGPWDGSSVQNATRNRNIVDTGRPTCILVHPTDPNIIYLGQAGGGLWRSRNASLDNPVDWVWDCVTETTSFGGNQSIGAAAFKPGDPNTIYISLGDMMYGSANQTADGRGFYISRNGGDTWEKGGNLGQTNRTKTVLALENNIILVAGNFGLFRSTDGGMNFIRVQSGPFRDGTGVHDAPIVSGGVTFPPNDYATAWDVVKLNDGTLVATYQFCDGGGKYDEPGFSGFGKYAGGGIAYSTDNGLTWTKASVNTSNRINTSMGFGRITIASSGNTLYGLAEEGNRTGTNYEYIRATNGYPALLKSTDGGRNWVYITAGSTDATRLFLGTGAYTSGGGDGGQFGYNQMIAVDPDDPDTVFVGTNLSVWRSTNGGADFICCTNWLASGREYTHADMHVAVWNKVGPKALYMATDGGLSIIRDPYAASWTGSGVVSTRTKIDHRRNYGMAAHLIYSFGNTAAATPTDSRNRVIIGTQDLGTLVRRDTSQDPYDKNFYDYSLGGDGFGCLIHSTNGNLMLGSLYNTRIYRSTNGGTSNTAFSSASSGITESNTSNAPFFTRLLHGAASTPDMVYTFTNPTPYRNANFGSGDWTAMTTTEASGWPRNYNTNGTLATSSPNIRSMGASPLVPGLVGVTFDRNEYNSSGTIVSRGAVAISEDNGSTWKVTQGIPYNPGNLGDIVFDTKNPNIMYLCGVRPAVWNIAGKVEGHTRHHLWKSTDKGKTWSTIDGTLTNSNGFPFGSMVHMVRVDPNNNQVVYAATDFGLYVTHNQGTTWTRHTTGLPMISVRDIYIAPDGSFMRVATHGRGVWEREGSIDPLAVSIVYQSSNIKAWPTQKATFIATANGLPTPTIQWQVSTNGSSWSNITNATSPIYTTDTLTPVDNGKQFRATFTGQNTVSSNPAVLTMGTFNFNNNKPGGEDVGVFDLLTFMTMYGSTEPAHLALADFNGDGKIDDADLAILLAAF